MSAPPLAENTDSPDAPEVNKPFWRKVYIVGITVGVVSILLNVWFKNGKWIDFGLTFCTATFVVGFCVTTYPTARSIWKHQLGAWFRRGCHAVVFFVAFIPARTLVSSAMKLPGQDFDATVAMLAVIVYPGLWLLLLSILCLLIGLQQLVKFYIIHISTLPLIDNFVKFVGKYIRNERIRAFIFEERKTIASFSLFQWMGATVTAILLMYCFDKIGETLASNDQIIKNIAYYTDYQIADDYPGIKKQFRYHLHENGVVSYAVKVNGKIQIQIDKLP